MEVLHISRGLVVAGCLTTWYMNNKCRHVLLCERVPPAAGNRPGASEPPEHNSGVRICVTQPFGSIPSELAVLIGSYI